MKALPPSEDNEPVLPPARDFDDHDFDDDDQPSWWTSLRPLSTMRATDPRPHDPEGSLDGPRSPEPAPRASAPIPVPVPEPPALPPPPPIRTRARAASDEVCATAHVLRVRARLAPDEQRRFDDLMRGPAATDLVTMLVNRSEADALDNLRRRLDDEPGASDAARRSLERHIAAVGALLAPLERTAALAALATLWPEELAALQSRLLALPPAEAAALIRAYLAPTALPPLPRR